MTGHELHLVAPDDLTAPRVDDDSLEILNDAIDTLARRRNPLLARRLQPSDSTP